MENNDQFLSVDNMKLCLSVFQKYMLDKYQFDIYTDGKETNVKKLLFDIMNDVNTKYKATTPPREMNNITLNIARDYYKNNYKIHRKNGKPAVKVLERDQNVYGPRILNFEQIKPLATTKKDITNEFERIQNNRQSEHEKRPPTIAEMKPISESAFDPDDFLKKVSELEMRRDDVEIRDLTTLNETRLQQDTSMLAQIESNPKALFQISQDKNIEAAEQQVFDINQIVSTREELLPPQVNQMILVDKFLSINGFDRNWTNDKNRFSFKVDFNWGENSIQQRYRNIKSMKATRAIIPMEIQQIQSIANVAKTYFNYEFSFAYPYLMLYIDEFDDVYDGTNQHVRRCFCHFVFDKCYKSPNGRGYIILNPIQDETKIFHPTPLTSLSKMSLSIRKPNGELLNNSRDEYKVFKVEYELYNKQYLKIVTDKYFDKNEFFRGDTIIIKEFQITNVNVAMNNDHIRKFNDFINRPEGHEVLEIGQANDSGFFRNFYINGPGQFDNTNGQFVLDSNLITNLNLFNDSIDYTCWTDCNGSILNASLQCVITFKLQSVTTDPSVVDTSLMSKIL